MTNDGRFSVVPLDVFADDRLTKNQMKVLCVLFSFRNKQTNVVFPSRQKISDMTGLPLTKISVITGELESLGWLRKSGKGGFSKSTRYELFDHVEISETVPETATVTDSVTVTETVTGGVTKTVTPTVTKTVTGKYQSNEQSNVSILNKDASPKAQPKASRLPDDWELPDEYARWCRVHRPDLNPHKVADQFKDYWIAQPGAKARKLNWFATWRNWCRNQKTPAQQHKSFVELEAEAKREWYEQASGKRSAVEYEPDMFDIAVNESRKHLRIAK